MASSDRRHPLRLKALFLRESFTARLEAAPFQGKSQTTFSWKSFYARTSHLHPMTRRRWIAEEFSGNQAALTGAHADHLVRVLRARVGQKFDISTGGVVRRGRIVSVRDDRVEFELGEEVPAVPVPNVTLLLAVFK